MKNLITVLAFCFVAPLICQNVNFDWAEHISGSHMEMINALTVDNQGNVYAAGSFDGNIDFIRSTDTVSFSSLSTKGFVCKVNASGNIVWAMEQPRTIRDILYDGDEHLITIGSGTNAVSKIDTTGQLDWSIHLSCSGSALAIDNSGDIYVSGEFNGTIDFDPDSSVFQLTGNSDVFILKLSPQGKFILAKQIGPICYASDIKVDQNKNILVSGFFAGNSDFDPGPSQYFLNSLNGYDGYFVKLDSAGGFIWANQLTGLGYILVNSIALDNNNVIVTGEFEGTCDFDPKIGQYNLMSSANQDAFLGKYDSDGELEWVKQFKSTHGATAHNLFVDDIGNIFSTGSFKGTCDFNPGSNYYNLTSSGTGHYGDDAFLSVLSQNGDFLYAGQLGVTGYCIGQTISYDPSGNIYVGGYFMDSVDLDPGSSIHNIIATDYWDAFLCMFSTSGFIDIDQHSTDYGLLIYPNPSSGSFIVELPNRERVLNIQVVDLWGRAIPFEVEDYPNALGISLSAAAGIYMVKIITYTGEFIQRVVVY